MPWPTPEPAALPAWHALLLVLPCLALALGAVTAATARGVDAAWRVARWSALAALGGAVLLAAALAVSPGGSAWGLRADFAGAAVALLASFIAWALVRFSRPYLAGEHGEQRGVALMLATLASAQAVVATDHLLLLALAWAGCGLALHGLLTFYGERAAAWRAARKNFVLTRVADVVMLAALGLLAFAPGTWDMNELRALAAQPGGLPAATQAAVVLVALAAVLRCAQLPFHGWLIQVMEAPTPVSALLHAGVVNLGGFVLIRLSPLVAETPAAQVLLVVAGTLTAVLASLVMSTRISVKVALAWSTCAQMGFMLLQCGLGLWSLALLHLVAHSLYKAHAFLRASSVVRDTNVRRLAQADAPPKLGALLSGALLSAVLTVAAALLAGLDAATPPALWVAVGIVALALSPLLQRRPKDDWRRIAAALSAFTLALGYFALHHLLDGAVQAPAPAAAPLWLVVALGFALLFTLQCLLAAAPRGALARRLYPWFFGGLFLDEWLSRLLLPRRVRLGRARPTAVPVLTPATTGGR